MIFQHVGNSMLLFYHEVVFGGFMVNLAVAASCYSDA